MAKKITKEKFTTIVNDINNEKNNEMLMITIMILIMIKIILRNRQMIIKND